MRNKTRRDLIKQRLKDELEASNLSYAQIAEKVGISQQMLTDYRNSRKMPSIETFSKICEVLEVDANYILGLID